MGPLKHMCFPINTHCGRIQSRDAEMWMRQAAGGQGWCPNPCVCAGVNCTNETKSWFLEEFPFVRTVMNKGSRTIPVLGMEERVSLQGTHTSPPDVGKQKH